MLADILLEALTSFSYWLLPALVCLIAASILIYNHLTHPLRRVPAIHWSAPWSSAHILCTKFFYGVRYTHYNAHLNRDGKAGFQPILRVGPNEVTIMSEQGADVVFTGGYDRAPWYDVFSNFGTKNMFSSTSRDIHSRRRRLLGSSYSKTSVHRPRVQNIIKSRIGQLMNFVEGQVILQERSVRKTSPIIIRNVTRPLEADIYTAFAFSEAEGTHFLDNLTNGPNTVDETGMGEIDLFHDEKRDPYWFWEAEAPSLFYRICPFLFSKGHKIHASAEKWISDLISHYEENAPVTKDTHESTYGKMFAWRDNHSGKPLSRQERASEIMDDCLAGHDSVPAALEFMVRQISLHPDVQSRLQSELRQNLPLNAQDRTMAMLDNLRYLNAVTMEGLRLVDTILSYETRTVPKGGCVIEGHFLPEGTTVATQPHLMNRLPTVFENPETFDPSRWMLPRDEYMALAKHMWTFSAGPRGCIAKEFALSIMKTFIVDIYIHYTTRLVNEDRQGKRPWEGLDRFSEFHFEHIQPSEKESEKSDETRVTARSAVHQDDAFAEKKESGSVSSSMAEVTHTATSTAASMLPQGHATSATVPII